MYGRLTLKDMKKTKKKKKIIQTAFLKIRSRLLDPNLFEPKGTYHEPHVQFDVDRCYNKLDNNTSPSIFLRYVIHDI